MPGKVWVSFRGGFGLGLSEVCCSTTLKGICEAVETSYGTAKGKIGGGDGPVTLYGLGNGDEGKAWTVVRVTVRKVKGRGGKMGNQGSYDGR